MDQFKEFPIWVTWRYEIIEKKKKDGTIEYKRTKVPYQPNGLNASSTDAKKWCTHNQAIQAKRKDGVGIVFEQSCGIIGIDFDHCMKDQKILFPEIEQLLKKAQTYIEFSPSKEGFHVLFTTKDRIDLETNKHYFDDSEIPCIEAYTWGRYFTYTGDEMSGFSKSIREIAEEEFFDLLKIVGYPWKKEYKKKKEIFTSIEKKLTDDVLLKKMFSSKNGKKIKQLYEGDISKHNNDESSADFALCLHLAYWTQKDATQIEKIWLSSPLGQREKTEKRQDYRDRTIQNAIEATGSVYEPINVITQKKDDRIDYDFICGGKNENIPLLIFPNITRVLRKNPHFKNKFRKNDFSHFVETHLQTQDWISLNDDTISLVREFIAENFSVFRKLSKDMTTDAIIRVAGDNLVNPPRDYFTSLVWDGTPRLNSWLHQTYGVPDDELNQAIGSNWIKGLVSRVMKPGYKFDEVLALEGPQGWLKSTSIRVLGDPWHVETTHSIENKDFYLLLAQNVIVEFSEGEIFDRASVKTLKAEITKTEDQVRPPYERGMMKFKRACVFAVTTNKLELKDDTGNRRWLPVILEKPADIDWLKKNRDQIFAEAFHRTIIVGESTHEYPKDTLIELQEKSGEWSDYDEKVLLWYTSLVPFVREQEGVTVHEACRAAFGDDVKIRKLEEMQIAGILCRTLYLAKRDKRINGLVTKRWFPTEKTLKMINKINPL